MVEGLCRLVGLLLAFAAAAGPVVRGQQTWARISGQPLADAASEWGQKNVDATYQLPAWTIVSLRDAVFPWAANDSASKGTSPPPAAGANGSGKPFSNGTFTILGAKPIDTSSPDGISSTVLDTGMRAGMVPPLVTSSLVYQNLSLVNLCTASVTVLGRIAVSPMLLAIFSGEHGTAVSTVNGIGTIMYLPASTMAWLAYGQMTVARAYPWPVVQQRYGPLRLLLGSLMQRMDMDIYAHEAFVMRNNVPRGPAIWRSMDKPGDPLMTFMRTRGLLMPARWCDNGTLLPEAVANSAIDLDAGPLYLANSTDEVLRGLVNATALAPVQEAAQRPPPGVVVFPPRLTLSEAPLPSARGAQLRLTAPLILAGPLSADARPLLDLTARSSALFALDGNGTLLITLLALYLPALPLPASQQQLVSALPLSALANRTSNATLAAALAPSFLVELYRTTLWLPILDYLALLTLATDGTPYAGVRRCVDNATLLHASLLQPGVQAVQLGIATSDSFMLAAYMGWGVNASSVLVLPQTPVPGTVRQALVPPPQARDSSPDCCGSTSMTGIIVGCTVGGVALLAVVVGAALLWRRRRIRDGRRQGSPDGVKAVPSAKAPGSSGSTVVADSADSKAAPDAVAVLVDDAAASNSSDLATVLQDHEQELLRRHACAASALAVGSSTGGTDTTPAAAAAAVVGGAGAALPSLHRAHEQLMSIVAARGDVRPGGGEGSGAGQGATPVLDHRKVVDRVAARLHGNSVDNTVVLEEVLGRGGGGVVYIGTWRGLPVAVKTITFEVWAGDEAAEAEGALGASKARLRYVQAIMETAISASVGHRHVVATYHYDFKRMDDKHLDKSGSGGLQVTNGASLDTTAQADSASVPEVQAFKVFLIQELCSCSLRKVLEYRAFQRNPDKLATVGDVLHQVALGLEYLHSKGIIHGDLTPGNILLKLDETEVGRLLAKLADFGFSTRLGQQATHVSNFCAGTPFYTAPEVTTQKRTSLASDIFSFGVVAWEMYAGCAPYTRNAQGALQCNPVFPAYPAGNRPPPEVEHLVMRCMSVDAKLRPPTSELVEMLSRHRGARSAVKVEAETVRDPPGLEQLKILMNQQRGRE